MIKKTPGEIWAEYARLQAYDDNLELPDTVRQCRNFFVDKQWEGVNAPDLEKPVFNIIKRTVNHCIAMIVSDDIMVQAGTFSENPAPEDQRAVKAANKKFEEIIERTKFKSKNRQLLKDCAVDGDGFFYVYFDPDTPTGQPARGEICVESVDIQSVFFGNTEAGEIQEQPYLIVSSRRMVDSVREESRKNGIADWDLIGADSNAEFYNSEYETADKVTVLLKMWKENGTVHMMKTTRNVAVRQEWDTGYGLYPLAYMSWEKVKNSCRGRSLVAGIIPNQIFINKMYAMAMKSVKNTAFPKMVYNRNLIRSWSNEAGAAIPVSGSPGEAVAVPQGVGEMSGQVMQMIGAVMNDTKNLLGATDAALGDVKPDNTSAIIAVQKAAVAPLELQKMAFYQFIEDCALIFLDMMSVDYGLRMVELENAETGQVTAELFDFSALKEMNLKLKIDVGEASYWSELVQIQTLDNLFNKGIIADPADYLDAIPGVYIRNKNKLAAKLRERQNAQAGATMGEPAGGKAPRKKGKKAAGMPDVSELLGQLGQMAGGGPGPDQMAGGGQMPPQMGPGGMPMI